MKKPTNTSTHTPLSTEQLAAAVGGIAVDLPGATGVSAGDDSLLEERFSFKPIRVVDS